jgi:hypothetical protein
MAGGGQVHRAPFSLGLTDQGQNLGS